MLTVKNLLLTAAFTTLLYLHGCDANTSQQNLADAQARIDNADYAAAIILLKNLVREDAESAQARWLLGKSHLGNGDAASAQKELEVARRLGWSNNDVLPALAEALLVQRRNQDVLSLEVFDLNTEAAGNVYAFQAVAAASLGRIQEADGLIAAALRESPDSFDIRMAKARIHAIQAQFPEAASELKHLLAPVSGSPEGSDKKSGSTSDRNQAQAWALLGDVELGRQRFEQALEAYKNAVALAPQNYGALFKRALLALERGQFQVAQQDVSVLLKKYPKHTGAHYIRGVLRFRAEKYAEAIASLSRAEPAADEFPMLLYFLSAAQLVDGQLESAIVNAAKFHQRAPQNIRGRLLYATALLKKTEYRKVQELLRPVVDAEPENVLALNLLANALLRAGQSEESIDLLTRIAVLQPESSVAQLRLGASLFLQGNNQKAQQYITTALSLEPEFQQAEMLLVVSHLEAKAYEQAIAAATNYAETEGESAVSLNLLGRVYRAAGQSENAVAAFEKALALHPKHPASHHNLAELAAQAGDLVRARSHHQKALESAPAHLATLLEVARLDAKLGDHVALEKRLRFAIEAHPQALEPRVFLGRYYLSQSRPEKVGPLFANLEPLQKNLPQVLELTARAQLAGGDFTAAKYAVSRLLEANPDSAALNHMLAAVNAGLGDREGTEAALRKSLLHDADNRQARLSLARLLLKEDRMEAFNEQLALLTAREPDDPALFALQAESSRRAGNIDAALHWSEKAFQHERTTDTVLAYGAARATVGNWQGAAKVYNDWLDLNPEDVAVRSSLARSYKQAGKAQESVSQFQVVLSQEPDNEEALNVLAWELRHSDTDQSLEHARRAAELAPRSAKALHTLALVEYVAKHYRRAARAAERALAENPNDLSLKYHSAMIDAARGEKVLAASKLRAVLGREKPFPQIEQARALLAKLSE